MANEKPTLGQAIDQTLQALTPLDESARKTVLTAVCMQLGIEAVGHVSNNTHAASHEAKQAPAPPASRPLATERIEARTDIRSLKEQKKPKSARQMACIVGYYLQEVAPEAERKESISRADLEKYFKQAGFRLPQHLDQLLKDAKAGGYFDSASRGTYKLNAVGYNLVVHGLPEKAAD